MKPVLEPMRPSSNDPPGITPPRASGLIDRWPVRVHRSLGMLGCFTVLSSAVAVSQAAVFHVAVDGSDAHPGSSSQPWASIQHAVDQMNAGDQTLVRDGLYVETILFSGAEDSGSPGSPVRLTGEPGARIDGNGLIPVGRQGLITIRDASHLIVEGFEVADFRTPPGNQIDDTPVGLLVEGDSDDLMLQHLLIHGIYNRSTCGQSTCGVGANGIGIYGTTPAGISDLALIGNEVRDCMLAASEAVTLNGNVSRVRIENNWVHDNNNIGIDLIGYEADTCPACSPAENRVRLAYVAGNRAINNSIKHSVGGIGPNPWYEGGDGSAGGFYVDGGQFVILDRNVASGNDLGFEFASEMPMRSTEDILMINNVLHANREVGLAVGGYAASSAGEGGGSAERIVVHNNSFWHNQGWGTDILFQYRVSDIQLINNIVVAAGDVSDAHFRQTNGQYGAIRFANNLWWAADVSGPSGVPGTGLIEDPLFHDPAQGDLNLQPGSPAIDAGQVEASLTGWDDPFWLSIFEGAEIPVHGERDIHGEARFEGPIDLGADEFGTAGLDQLFSDGFE